MPPKSRMPAWCSSAARPPSSWQSTWTRSACPFWAPRQMPSMKQRIVSASTSCWSAAGSPAHRAALSLIWTRLWLPPTRSACRVLMRPSYVLGGQNMIVAYTKADVIEYMGVITEHVDMDHPVLLDKYILGTECEVDAICDGENFLIPRHYGAGGAHRRALRRLHLCLPGTAPDSGRDRHHSGLHRPLCPRAACQRSGERAVRSFQRQGVRH